jgi:2-haloacid dehalogenase
VKALLFDVFGTVVDWRAGVVRDVTELSQAAGTEVDAGAFADAWRAGYGPAMDLVRRGELPWTKLDDLHRRTVDRLLAEFGLTGLDPAQQDWLNTSWHRLDPWPDALDGLRRLKRRFVISAFSRPRRPTRRRRGSTHSRSRTSAHWRTRSAHNRNMPLQRVNNVRLAFTTRC